MSEPTTAEPGSTAGDVITVHIRRDDFTLPGGRTLRFKAVTDRRLVPPRPKLAKAVAGLLAPPAGAPAIEQAPTAYTAHVHRFQTAGGLVVELWTTPARDQLIGEITMRDGSEPPRADVDAIRALFWPRGMEVEIKPSVRGKPRFRLYNRRSVVAAASASSSSP